MQPDFDMPEFREGDGVWVWDSESGTYSWKPSADLEPDRGHSTGGDNDLFNQSQLEHSELEGSPETEGFMSSSKTAAGFDMSLPAPWQRRPWESNCPNCRGTLDKNGECRRCGFGKHQNLEGPDGSGIKWQQPNMGWSFASFFNDLLAPLGLRGLEQQNPEMYSQLHDAVLQITGGLIPEAYHARENWDAGKKFVIKQLQKSPEWAKLFIPNADLRPQFDQEYADQFTNGVIPKTRTPSVFSSVQQPRPGETFEFYNDYFGWSKAKLLSVDAQGYSLEVDPNVWGESPVTMPPEVWKHLVDIGEIISTNSEPSISDYMPGEDDLPPTHLPGVEPNNAVWSHVVAGYIVLGSEWDNFDLADSPEQDPVWQRTVPFLAYPNGKFLIGRPGQDHSMIQGADPNWFANASTQGRIIFDPQQGEITQWPVDRQTMQEPEWLTPETKNGILMMARRRWRAQNGGQQQQVARIITAAYLTIEEAREIGKKYIEEHPEFLPDHLAVEWAPPGKVKCPNCEGATDAHVCPTCGKDLTPEWNARNDGDVLPVQHERDNTTEHHTFPDVVPKRNREKTDDSYPSMTLSHIESGWDDALRIDPAMPEFSHVDEELQWKEANTPSLDECPECRDPMFDQGGDKVCTSCGHKQPILYHHAAPVEVVATTKILSHKEKGDVNALLVTARQGGKVVGYLAAEPYNEGFLTDYVFVSPEVRRQGIAKMLVAKAREYGLVPYASLPVEEQVYKSEAGKALAAKTFAATANHRVARVVVAGPALLAVPEVAGLGAEAVGAGGAGSALTGIAGDGAGLMSKIPGIGSLMNKALLGGAFQEGQNAVGGGQVEPGGGMSPDYSQLQGIVSKFQKDASFTKNAIIGEIVQKILGYLGQAGKSLIHPANPLDDVLVAGGNALNNAIQNQQQQVPVQASVFHAIGAGGPGDDNVGMATKNDGTNSTDEASDSGIEGKKEQGDGPEQLKDVDGAGDAKGDAFPQDDLKNQGDPALQDKALKVFHLNLPLVLEFAGSDEAGSDNPILQAIDAMLEEAFPGYKDGTDQDNGATSEHPADEAAESEPDSDDSEEKKPEPKEASVWHFAFEDGPDPGYGHGRSYDPQPGDEDYEHVMRGGNPHDFSAPDAPVGQYGCPNCDYTSNDYADGLCPHCGEELDDVDHGYDDHLRELDNEQAPGHYDLYGPDQPTWKDMFPHEATFGTPMAPGQIPTGADNGVAALPTQAPVCPMCHQTHAPGTACPAQNMNVNQQAPQMTGAPITPPQPNTVVTKWQVVAVDVEAGYGSITSKPYCPSCGAEMTADQLGNPHGPCPNCGATADMGRAVDFMGSEAPDSNVTNMDQHLLDRYEQVAPNAGHSVRASEDPEWLFYASDHDDKSNNDHESDHDQEVGDRPMNTDEDTSADDGPGDPTDWLDTDGQPLVEGQEYEMLPQGGPDAYAIPDRVTIKAILPHKIVYEIQSGDLPYEDEITKQQADLDGLTFSPIGDGTDPYDSLDGFQNDEAPIRPGQDATPQVDDLTEPPTVVSSTQEFEPVSLDNYTGSFSGDPVEDRSWLMEDSSAVEVDPALMSKLAGKDFTPREQREFINESGEARNLDRLQLEGTHYVMDDMDHEVALW